MRILLIATNRHKQLNSRMNAQPLPIGLAYIAGHLDSDPAYREDAGSDVFR